MTDSVEAKWRNIVWISYIFIGWILGVIQLYAIHRFNSIKHLIIVQKRYPQIVFCEAVITALYLLFILPFVNKDVLRVQLWEPYGTLMSYIFYPILAHAVANAEAARLWLIYFDLNYLRSLKNESWKSIINIKQKNKDWFLNYKHKYGNKKWIITRVFIYYFISAATSCCLWLFFESHSWTRSIDGCLYGVPVIITLYVYYKCPTHCIDYFLFQYEFKQSSICMLISMIIYLIAQIVWYFNEFVSDLMVVSVSTFPSFLSLISTLWIPYKILTQKTWKNKYKKKHEYVMKVINDGQKSPSISTTNVPPTTSINTKLLNTLQNEDDLELFVNHISNEFSSEVILCFIECVQYKKYFGNILNRSHQYQHGACFILEDLENSKTYSYDLHETIPKSSIVYGDDDEDENKEKNFEDKEALITYIKNSAYLLYKKYIIVGAELEINISSSLRNRYNIMNDYDLWMETDEIDENELIAIFDPIIEQMFYLMNQSFIRYANN